MYGKTQSDAVHLDPPTRVKSVLPRPCQRKAHWADTQGVSYPPHFGLQFWLYLVSPVPSSSPAKMYDIVDLPGRGKGLVASRLIKAGTLIADERPLLVVVVVVKTAYGPEMELPVACRWLFLYATMQVYNTYVVLGDLETAYKYTREVVVAGKKQLNSFEKRTSMERLAEEPHFNKGKHLVEEIRGLLMASCSELDMSD